MKRPSLSFVTVVVLILVGYGVWRFLPRKNLDAIPVKGGQSMSVRLVETGPVYLQRDPKWADDKLGRTEETLGSVGCLVCSVAMAANALGEQTSPKELNEALSRDGGYTDRGWLVWSKLGPIFGNRVESVVSARPSHEEIDRALEKGERPVVKFMLWDIVPHWVAVVGKDGLDYLVRDPLEEGKEPVRLSTRTDQIESVRILRKAVGASAAGQGTPR